MTYSSIFEKNSKEVRQNEPLCFFFYRTSSLY